MESKKTKRVRMEEWQVEFLLDLLVEAQDAADEQARTLRKKAGTRLDDATMNGLRLFHGRCNDCRRRLLDLD